MSRIGRNPITVPANVKVQISDGRIQVEGPKGKLEFSHRPQVALEYDQAAGRIVVTRDSDVRESRALHGLNRALIQNMVVGVTQGYEKKLEIVGVGYLGAVQGNILQVRAGYANEVHTPIPAGLTVKCPDQTHIVIQGADKQMVGQFAAEIRAIRKPEPYKGKGIRYDGESVRRKAGKTTIK